VDGEDAATGRGGILVYVDGSDTCITAAQYAIFLARTLARPLAAIYVVETKVLADLIKARIFVKAEAADYEYDLQEDGKRYLSYVEKLAGAKGVACKTELATGEVNVEVVRKAEEMAAEVLVLNELERHRSRRESHLDEKERILRRVKCTVVIAKDEEAVARLYDEL
jgi:nucleotide-binding universal stress UspA family protein